MKMEGRRGVLDSSRPTFHPDLRVDKPFPALFRLTFGGSFLFVGFICTLSLPNVGTRIDLAALNAET
jgi:hypothetical protein